MKKHYLSGFCQHERHGKCPEVGQAKRFTSKGQEIRELLCACTCHAVKRLERRVKHLEALLEGDGK